MKSTVTQPQNLTAYLETGWQIEVILILKTAGYWKLLNPKICYFVLNGKQMLFLIII